MHKFRQIQKYTDFDLHIPAWVVLVVAVFCITIGIFIGSTIQQWLLRNSWKYGFILRYPNDKSEITGIRYEPWHYRYVGKQAAKEIYEAKICLEEYLDH